MKRDASYDDFPDDSEIDADLFETVPLNYNDILYPGNELYPNYDLADITYEKRYLGKFCFDSLNSVIFGKNLYFWLLSLIYYNWLILRIRA